MKKRLKQLQNPIDPEWARFKTEFPKFPGVARCMELLHHCKGARLDAVMGELSDHAAEYLNELVEAFRAESNARVRVLLLSAIAEAGLPAAVPFLTETLHSGDERLRFWAITGLRNANTKESRRALWEAEVRETGVQH